MFNAHNRGYLAGTLAEAPEIKETRNGAHSIDFIVVSSNDPADKSKLAPYRNSQKVKIQVYIQEEGILARFKDLKEGCYFACWYWVNSYTYTDKNGGEHLGNSLSSYHSDITVNPDGPTPPPDPYGTDGIPDFDDPYSDFGYIPIGQDYNGPDFDFMDTEDIEDMARAGDVEAQWYGTKYRGLDYDDFDDIVY